MRKFLTAGENFSDCCWVSQDCCWQTKKRMTSSHVASMIVQCVWSFSNYRIYVKSATWVSDPSHSIKKIQDAKQTEKRPIPFDQKRATNHQRPQLKKHDQLHRLYFFLNPLEAQACYSAPVAFFVRSTKLPLACAAGVVGMVARECGMWSVKCESGLSVANVQIPHSLHTEVKSQRGHQGQIVEIGNLPYVH